MTITYILQILDDIEKGDSKKYGVITDMNGELQKAVRRARRRITRLRFRAQYELEEMDKAKVAAANDHMPRFIRVLDKIRNLNLEDCRGLQGIEDFLDDENRVHEVVEMAQKIGQLSVISSSAYTPMALGFGLLETHTSLDDIEIDNAKFKTMEPVYAKTSKKKYSHSGNGCAVSATILKILHTVRKKKPMPSMTLPITLPMEWKAQNGYKCRQAATGQCILWYRKCKSEEPYRWHS